MITKRTYYHREVQYRKEGILGLIAVGIFSMLFAITYHTPLEFNISVPFKDRHEQLLKELGPVRNGNVR